MQQWMKVVLVCVVLGVSGVSQAAVIVFNTTMTGDQANAGQGTGSTGKGAGTMSLDTDTGLFSWFIAWENLVGEVTTAHFHGPATPDQNGGVQLGIDFTSNPTSGTAVLTDVQIVDLLAGLWYVNIHSTVNPGGEIRGQVLALTPVPIPGAIWMFGAALLALTRFSKRH